MASTTGPFSMPDAAKKQRPASPPPATGVHVKYSHGAAFEAVWHATQQSPAVAAGSAPGLPPSHRRWSHSDAAA
jgi:hypothetical protein